MAIDESVGIVGVGWSLLDHLGRGEKKATEEDLCRNSGPDKDFMAISPKRGLIMSPALGEFFRRATVVLNEATLGRPMNFDCIYIIRDHLDKEPKESTVESRAAKKQRKRAKKMGGGGIVVDVPELVA